MILIHFICLSSCVIFFFIKNIFSYLIFKFYLKFGNHENTTKMFKTLPGAEIYTYKVTSYLHIFYKCIKKLSCEGFFLIIFYRVI